jgi:tetratricopeptide (TPR) repeat protein
MRRSAVGAVGVAMTAALLSLASPLRAQAPGAASRTARADSLLRHRDWAGAAAAFRAALRADSMDGRSWYLLGYALQQHGDFTGAIAAYRRAVDLYRVKANAMYNLATAYARLDQADSALEWLGRAADAGFSQLQVLDTDPDLASVRADPRYASVRQRVLAKAEPCRSRPEYRQFDFWVGDWNVVRTADGAVAGRSHVELVLNQCVIFENWTDAHGGAGKSFNIYNAATGRWHQTWVSAFGVRKDFDGGYRDGAMRLQTHPDSSRAIERITWYDFAPDSVRQVGEASSDGGGSWTPQYDLMYHRVPPH